ncbi:MAG: hypothetical protein O2887_14705 [Bacteroidetes bacterium]|nr:hypothetical protein [Bacteroidota bacterium]MDA1121719.1 hypothetical protein [Bacteroidota bacterium]
MEEEPTIVPVYETSTFKKGIGFITVAVVLTILLYFLKPDEPDYDQVVSSGTSEIIEHLLPDGSIIQLNAKSEIKYSSEAWEEE